MSEELEHFYDEHIAPDLMRLARAFHEKGGSLLATAEWAPGEGGTTAAIQANAGLPIHLAHWGATSRANVDSLFMAIIDHAKKHGHSSIFLKQLGVPLEPQP